MTRSQGRVQAIPISSPVAASASLRVDLSDTATGAWEACGGEETSSADTGDGSWTRPWLIALRSVSNLTSSSLATSLRE